MRTGFAPYLETLETKLQQNRYWFGRGRDRLSLANRSDMGSPTRVGDCRNDGSGSFTYAVLGDQAVKLGAPQNYRLEYMNGALSLIFTLPFALPIAPAPSKDLTILVLDPTYFIAFELAKVNPVRLAKGAPQSCKVTIGELAEGSAEAQRLSKAFAELGPELGYTQISAIGC